MPKLKKAVSLLFALIMSLTMLSQTVFADEPYEGYTFDWWLDALPSQNGYVANKAVRGSDIEGCGAFNAPQDMFVSTDNKFYVADTGNSRIVILDENLNYLSQIKEVKLKDGTASAIKEPQGVYVNEDNEIFISDTGNQRVLCCKEDLTAFAILTKPDAASYTAEHFKPQKIIADAADNVYIIDSSVTQGSLLYTYDRVIDTVDFKGYYGANRVQTTATVLKNKIFSLFLTREQMTKRARSVPAIITNFDIDNDGFIYTVTSSKTQEKDILKKLNPAGTNIFVNKGYSDYTFGNRKPRYYQGTNYISTISDVDVGTNGIITLLDNTTKKIFQYDEECDLLFVFGGEGNQVGTFINPVAIETLGQNIYVLDATKNNITKFERTEFGNYVLSAVELYLKGMYDEALEPWNEVLRRDGNYRFAYVGIGKAYLNMGEYDQAMKYFKRTNWSGYNKAFKYYRRDFIRDHFTEIAIGLLVLVIGAAVLNKILKKRKKKRELEFDKADILKNTKKEGV